MRIYVAENPRGYRLVGDLLADLWVVPVVAGGWESRKLYAMPACRERSEGLREQPSEASRQPFDLGVPSELIERRSGAQVVGSRIRAARVRAGMTQIVLAGLLPAKYDRTNISAWESGRRSTMIATLYRIAWALDCDIRELI